MHFEEETVSLGGLGHQDVQIVRVALAVDGSASSPGQVCVDERLKSGRLPKRHLGPAFQRLLHRFSVLQDARKAAGECRTGLPPPQPPFAMEKWSWNQVSLEIGTPREDSIEGRTASAGRRGGGDLEASCGHDGWSETGRRRSEGAQGQSRVIEGV